MWRRPSFVVACGIAAGVLFSASCGYVGPIVPPSPELPNAITDLAVIERGNQLAISFSTPPRTTDNTAIKRFSKIDLAIGPDIQPWDFERWSQTARHMELSPPPPNDPNAPLYQAMHASQPVSDWVGKKIAVAVRTAVKKKDHFSQWSNRVVLSVIPPLHPPVVSVQPAAEGYRLTWPEERPGMHFDIFRQGPSDKQPTAIGASEKPEYLDTTSQWDTPYTYTVVALLGSAESLPSEPVHIVHADTFPPSVPAGVTALATPESIDITWQHVTSANLKGYYLYRSVNGGPFTRDGALLTLPAYSDHNVEHGKTYRYEVSSLSQKGYESAKSAPSPEVTYEP
jgi:hypothetical protein